MPTRLGPMRSCTQAAIHRSSSTKYAAAVIRPPSRMRDFDERLRARGARFRVRGCKLRVRQRRPTAIEHVQPVDSLSNRRRHRGTPVGGGEERNLRGHFVQHAGARCTGRACRAVASTAALRLARRPADGWPSERLQPIVRSSRTSLRARRTWRPAVDSRPVPTAARRTILHDQQSCTPANCSAVASSFQGRLVAAGDPDARRMLRLLAARPESRPSSSRPPPKCGDDCFDAAAVRALLRMDREAVRELSRLSPTTGTGPTASTALRIESLRIYLPSRYASSTVRCGESTAARRPAFRSFCVELAAASRDHSTFDIAVFSAASQLGQRGSASCTWCQP